MKFQVAEEHGGSPRSCPECGQEVIVPPAPVPSPVLPRRIVLIGVAIVAALVLMAVLFDRLTSNPGPAFGTVGASVGVPVKGGR